MTLLKMNCSGYFEMANQDLQKRFNDISKSLRAVDRDILINQPKQITNGDYLVEFSNATNNMGIDKVLTESKISGSFQINVRFEQV